MWAKHTVTARFILALTGNLKQGVCGSDSVALPLSFVTRIVFFVSSQAQRNRAAGSLETQPDKDEVQFMASAI